ncbi:MAG TPA: cysteine synthase A [Elusimicrobia bacterium]|nr:cysteine synthase A [Elusimicrobiota bacterium]
MKYAADMSGLIGRTPLVKINRLAAGGSALLLAKLESFNPSFSVKDRAAYGMLKDAEDRGLLMPGARIVEPTSGNTGIGLAWLCAIKGYRLVLTMPDTMSVERRKILHAFGAEIVLTPGPAGMAGAVAKAEEILAATPGSFMPRQFSNPANPAVHQRTTGEEILADTDGKIDVFVAGVGTGGTITGVARALKNRRPGVKIIAVEPAASPVLSGGAAGPHRLQGIGANFTPEILDLSLLDQVVKVTDVNAGIMARRLMAEEGILAGISSGAAMQAAVEAALKPEYSGKTIVVILPDTGERYLSTWLFDDLPPAGAANL